MCQRAATPSDIIISYDNPDAVSLNSAGEISIEIVQKPMVILEIGEYPTEVESGDKVNITIQVINKGKSRICNVECTSDVPELKQKNSLYLGDIEMSSAANGDTKPMLQPLLIKIPA